MATLTITRPTTQAEYDALDKQLADFMLRALRSDLREQAGLTQEQAYQQVQDIARMLKSCTKSAARKRDLQETITAFAWE